MKILAISGSARQLSTNTALLHALSATAPHDVCIEVFDGIGRLPIFSPDLEGQSLPPSVQSFVEVIGASDGLIISSPEYVRSIPGGLKNALDWLVSGDQIVAKPIALIHGSHRGDDMLIELRRVLSTVSSKFAAELFWRIPVMKQSPESIRKTIGSRGIREEAEAFLDDFVNFCRYSDSADSGTS